MKKFRHGIDEITGYLYREFKIDAEFIGFEYDQNNMRYRDVDGNNSKKKFITNPKMAQPESEDTLSQQPVSSQTNEDDDESEQIVDSILDSMIESKEIETIPISVTNVIDSIIDTVISKQHDKYRHSVFKIGAKMLKVNALKAMFDSADMDKTGLINFEQFQRVISDINVNENTEINSLKNEINKSDSAKDDEQMIKYYPSGFESDVISENEPSDDYEDIHSVYDDFRQSVFGQSAKKLNVNELRLIFDKADKDRNSVLDFMEFTALCNRMNKDGNVKDAKLYFDERDVDQNGVIDFEEFVQAILGINVDEEAMNQAIKYSNDGMNTTRKMKSLLTQYNDIADLYR